MYGLCAVSSNGVPRQNQLVLEHFRCPMIPAVPENRLIIISAWPLQQWASRYTKHSLPESWQGVNLSSRPHARLSALSEQRTQSLLMRAQCLEKWSNVRPGIWGAQRNKSNLRMPDQNCANATTCLISRLRLLRFSCAADAQSMPGVTDPFPSKTLHAPRRSVQCLSWMR